MTATVYTITHRASGKEYVGMTGRAVRKRWAFHVSSRARVRTKIGLALNKYGSEAFDFRVIAELPTRPEAEIAERILIAIRKPELNIAAGGDSGMLGAKHPPRSAETKARLSASRKGVSTGRRDSRKASAASAEKRRGLPNPTHAAFMTGRKASAETRAKMSTSQRSRRLLEKSCRGSF